MADRGDELRVEVVPWGPGVAAVQAAARTALEQLAVREELAEAETRLLSAAPLAPDVGDGGVAEPTHVRATVYDYTNERTLVVEAPMDRSSHVNVTSTVRQPPPSGEEFDAAVEALRANPELGPLVAEGGLKAYRPMPPVVLQELPEGRIERTVAVGLAPAEGGQHEIVGVRAADGAVSRFEGGAPIGAVAGAPCGLANAFQPTAARGTPGQARVTVSRAGEVLWTFIAVRPAASSGTNGSGIELRAVAYRGKRVLRQAHVPILNVRYDGDACGPYRDWQYQEGMLVANGADVAPGFRLCPDPAQTVLDSGDDQGNFLGVAIYVDGEEVVLVSELEAGWYRYISEWRLDADGTIRPRFRFGAVENPCVCNIHHHHVYWRLDFDIATAANNAVREFNDPPVAAERWHTLRHEIRRRRNPDRQRRWRVVNRISREGYTLVPGSDDGAANEFGIGDLWALRCRRGQIDDGVGFTQDPALARAGLDRFLTGESIYNTDIVLWYAAHFSHDVGAEEPGEHGHTVGPELVPERW